MITLKDYQIRVLDTLRDFFRQCSKTGRPEIAYQEAQLNNGRSPVRYIPVTASGIMPGMPYVCVRVPTGGGKTLLACYTTGLAINELLRAERAVVLWLVPSNTILDQTAEALRNPRHAYRRALDLSCGSVEVLTIEEALQVSRATVEGQTIVIVATIQSFRVEDTTGRKVYAQNGVFSEHILNVPIDRLDDLLPGADGKPKPSLVNMLRLQRPIVIVDEAHNARTDLSFATLGNLLPSCVIEFTATPDLTKQASNVLHHVSAAELKTANMIKLPIRIIMRHPSQRDQLLAEATTLRADLEKLAIAESQKTGEYLRPIMLIQAERVDACEPLRSKLVSEFNIDKDQIKISIGKLDELKNVLDITSPKCAVRFIITVEKLREGWDCPFAYVLCSLKETHSATAIEQIVGRILRLPKAEAKQHPDLNCAYAFSVSQSISEVLNEFKEALEHNGFTSAEAERIILPVPQGALPFGVQPKTAHFEPAKEIDLEIAAMQTPSLVGKVNIDLTRGEVTINIPLNKDETEQLTSCMKTPEAKQRIENLNMLVKETEKAFGEGTEILLSSGYQSRFDFIVPRLCIKENQTLLEFESTFLIEHDWKLSEKDASLSQDYNPLIRPDAKAGLVDISKAGKIETSEVRETPAIEYMANLHQSVMELQGTGDWTMENLVVWLDRHIDHRDIPLSESAVFIMKVIRGLMAKFSISDVNMLVIDRFRLRDEIETRIQQHRDSERNKAFQSLLLPKSPLEVSNEFSINFKDIIYDPSWLYKGSYQFKKHYYGPKPGELDEHTSKGAIKEEFQCAQFIDGQSEIRYWVRNLPRRSTSFRLLTTKDWFYPDFICQLNDGRILVVEYKGEHIFEFAPEEEKKAIGAVWAGRSNGKCLFVMPTKKNLGEICDAIRKSK
ncbi:MAG: DEAD/DEAH box helicase family protein [Dehalococcoidia bacterium]|nr:DEAD/DEAH box helicase family protein [Dehalococcoidia bacterium]